jgi:hypothetical protein
MEARMTGTGPIGASFFPFHQDQQGGGTGGGGSQGGGGKSDLDLPDDGKTQDKPKPKE